MATIQNIFTNARMDSDTHYTLMDNKGYVRAENLRLTGEGENGSFNNIKSSLNVCHLTDDGMVEVGAYEGFNNKSYHFFAKPNRHSMIVEYDVETRESRIIIEDFDVLRFDLIRWKSGAEIKSLRFLLSINQIGDLLIFSNEVWEYPRVVNLSRLKDYELGFTEEDITLQKKPPKTAPVISNAVKSTTNEGNTDNDIFVSFAYRYKYKDGDYSPLSFYSETAFTPKTFFNINTEKFNEAMVNSYDNIELTINTGGKNVTDIEVYAREHGSNTAYRIYNVNKEAHNIGDDETETISYNFSKNYEVLNTEETNYLFSLVPRYPKSQDVVGNRLCYYNYFEGRDIENADGSNINIDYTVQKHTEAFSYGGDNTTAVSMFKYKVGVIFYNDYNESTTVLLPTDETKSEVKTLYADRTSRQQLRVIMESKAPYWATKMKFAVQSQPLNYDNIFFNRGKRLGSYVYLEVTGHDIEKVKVGDEIFFTNEEYSSLRIYRVEKVQQFTKDKDGVPSDGVYAVVRDRDKMIDAPDSSNAEEKKEYKKGMLLRVDQDSGQDPERFAMLTLDGSQGCQITYHSDIDNYGYYDSPPDKGDIAMNNALLNKMACFGNNIAIEPNDTVEYTIRTHYIRYVSKEGGNGGRDLDNITFDYTFVSDDNYASVSDFISEVHEDSKFIFTKVGNEFKINTTDDYKEYILNNHKVLQDLDNKKGFRLNVFFGIEINIIKGSTKLYARTINKETIDTLFYETPKTYYISNGVIMGDGVASNKPYFDIGFYNGYCWGNGVESYRIKDNFNGKKIDYNFRPNAVSLQGYKEVHKKNDLTHSGIYNYELGLNYLSSFNALTNNQKTLPINWGEGQRIMSTDSDLVVFNPNKILRVLFGKSVLMDVQGNENVALSDEVLGAVITLDYETGISYNPESIAKTENLFYFVDKNRASINVLSGRQIETVNHLGCGIYKETVDFIKANDTFLGEYNEALDEYVLGVNNKIVYCFGMSYKGFGYIQEYPFDYLFEMNGKMFQSYKGIIYEAEAGSDYGSFVGQPTIESKLVYIVNTEFNTDTVYEAQSLQSNVAWNTTLETNLTKTIIPEEQYLKKESFFYTYINPDISEDIYHNAKGIGIVTNSVGKEIKFNFIPTNINVGDNIHVEGKGSFTIESVVGTVVTTNEKSGYNVGDFAFTTPRRTTTYNPNGKPIRGKWMKVELTKKSTKPIYITSTTTEASKSF